MTRTTMLPICRVCWFKTKRRWKNVKNCCPNITGDLLRIMSILIPWLNCLIEYCTRVYRSFLWHQYHKRQSRESSTERMYITLEGIESSKDHAADESNEDHMQTTKVSKEAKRVWAQTTKLSSFTVKTTIPQVNFELCSWVKMEGLNTLSNTCVWCSRHEWKKAIEIMVYCGVAIFDEFGLELWWG